MSTSDGEPSKRLSDALDEIFSQGSSSAPADGDLDEVPDATPQPYELPEIVPATVEPAPEPPAPPPTPPAAETIAPTLPQQRSARAAAPAPEPRVAPIPSSRTAASPAAAAAPARTTPATSWSDHMTSRPAPSGGGSAALRAPGRRPRVRRVTRVLRHIDPWSTFKVGLLFSLVTYVVLLTSGVLLWRVADSTGTLANVERWFTQFGWETFELKGGEIFHNAWIIGLFGVVGMTGGLVLLATLFNLVSDIIGGIRLTVLEEEVVERTVTSTRRYVVRQGPAATAAAAAQDWDVDDDEPAPARPSSGPAADPEATQPVPTTDRAPTADWSIDDD